MTPISYANTIGHYQPVQLCSPVRSSSVSGLSDFHCQRYACIAKKYVKRPHQYLFLFNINAYACIFKGLLFLFFFSGFACDLFIRLDKERIDLHMECEDLLLSLEQVERGRVNTLVEL